jgi:Trypsin-co-occurring domain 2
VKGHISLGDFIADVKSELQAARSTDDAAFMQLDKIALEVTFALSIEAGAKAKFIVIEAGGRSNGKQTHKVTLTFSPLPSNPVKTIADQPRPSGGGGGRVFDPLHERPRYGPSK